MLDSPREVPDGGLGTVRVRTTDSAKLAALWLPALVWMGLIFWVSSLPGSQVPGGYSTSGHFIAYAVLGGLLVAPLLRVLGRGRAVAFAVLIASFYGVTDEFHQAFVPMRTPDIADWGVDTLGAFFGALVVAWLASAAGRAIERRKAQ